MATKKQVTERDLYQSVPADRNDWLGSRLRDFRLEIGVSAADLGEAIGLHEQTIFAYEQGKIGIPWDNVLIICRLLGADPVPLVGQYTRRWFGRRRLLVARSPAKS